jgi:SAM-dependent methyltransferase
VTDPLTVAAYDRDPAGYAEDWETQPPPVDLHALVHEFFAPGPTADVGCGSGRDTAWLAGQGFDVVGYDASEELLGEARRRHPGIRFEHAELPDLAGVPSGFANVLCETVVMHLPVRSVAPAVRRLVQLLAPGGTLYLSWRVTGGGDVRDDAGRLYAAFDADVVRAALVDVEVLHDEQRTSASSGRVVHRVIARRPPARPA